MNVDDVNTVQRNENAFKRPKKRKAPPHGMKLNFFYIFNIYCRNDTNTQYVISINMYIRGVYIWV